MKAPHHLAAAWPSLRAHFARPERVALFTDFDGTLVRIERRHTGGRLPANVRRLLHEIAATGAVVGVISGRRLDDLRSRVRLPGLWYAGAHGFFLCDPAGRRTTLLGRKDRNRIARAERKLRRGLRGLAGVGLEPKGASVAVHYRGASRRSAQLARRAVEDVMVDDRSLHLMSGKKIWEILPGTEIDKWAAVRWVLRRARKGNPRAGRVLVYLGDDTTDERVFAKMRGISVAVGKKTRTAARYFLRSPAEVRQFLKTVKECCQ